MKVEMFQTIPEYAIEIRKKVFMAEQGFQNEFDDIDLIAMHFVLFDDLDMPIATCRVFQKENDGIYFLGRLAVVKECRGKNIGSILINHVEAYVKKIGGEQIQLHAQCRVAAFYNKLGFSPFGNVEDEEGCPHIWMRKML